MKAEQLDKLLENVPNPISHIERDLGMPATVLQKALKGKRNLPKKWAIALKSYVENKQYLLFGAIPHIPPSKREIVEQVVKDFPKTQSDTNPVEPVKSVPNWIRREPKKKEIPPPTQQMPEVLVFAQEIQEATTKEQLNVIWEEILRAVNKKRVTQQEYGLITDVWGKKLDEIKK